MLLREMTTGAMARWAGTLIMLIQLWTSAAFAQADAKAVARIHFEKGVAAFNDKRFAQAAAEFDAAYRLSPANVVLYNIGQVDVILGRSVEAVAALEKYLVDGAGSVAPERQAEVRAEVEEQRSHIGAVMVSTQPVDAELRVDGLVVGHTPLAQPLSLAVGSHTIEARRPGYVSQLREITLGGKSRIGLELTLGPVLPTVASEEPSAPPVSPLAAGPPPSREKTSLNWRRISGYALAGIGLIAAVTGGIVAVQSVGAADDARNRAIAATEAEKPTLMDVTNYDQAKADFDSAVSRNHLGWIVAGAGVAALAGGFALVVTSPERKATAGPSGPTPWVAPRAGGLALAVCW